VIIPSGTNLGHYEIRSKIGEGGMGEVYLAQDMKLDRNVALKILPANVADDRDRMNRFVREARSASALNHPNIITIHEIDHTDSIHFIATEFIDGETLRQRIQSAPMKLGEALDVAAQIASALSSAHYAGIVHRDIKPENIMRRRDGIVKVLDFGLAKLTELMPPEAVDSKSPTRAQIKTKEGVVIGTPVYMSPEQARGLPIDLRTDIFSLGVLIYEMIAGRLPFDGSNTNEILASILSDKESPPLARYSREVPDELERIVSKALRKDREARYQNVRDLLIDLKDLARELEFGVRLERSSKPSSGFHDQVALKTAEAQAAASVEKAAIPTISRAKILPSEIKRNYLGIVLGLGALVLAAASFFYFHRRPTLTEKDTILLADFVNTTGDAAFDGSTLKQALAVQLRQTPFLRLFPEEGARETLRYMGHSEDERVTRPVGREICQRRGLKALLVGTIASLGRNYVITLEAINGQTGEAIASHQIEAEGKEQVLKSLGQAALELRRQLGESLSTLQKYNAPIEQATTSSLEALNVYSKGLEQIYSGNYKAALPLFNRAVELDPNFAEAYVWLCWTHVNFVDGQERVFAEKAYALRDRVTELEKLRIDDIYNLWATGDWDKQKEADELIARLYPNDWVPHNSLAIGYYATGQPEKAVAAAREGIRVNPNEVHLYWHLSNALIRLNRFDEARDAIRQGQAQKLDHLWYHQNLYLIAFTQGDAATMQRQLDSIRQNQGEPAALRWQARAMAVAGHWLEAQRLYFRAAELGQHDALGRPAGAPIDVTILQAHFGFCEITRNDASKALALLRITSPRQVLYVPILSNGSLCGDAGQAQKLADEQAKRYPRSFMVNLVSVPIIRAAIALQQNQPDQAIKLLNPAIPYESGTGGFWPTYLRGQSWLRLGKTNEAGAEFRKILDHRGWDPLSPFYPLAHLGLARAFALQGDSTAARKAYQDFFAFWKDADPDIPILIEARSEYEKIR
jgi:eukaryotic-like serine/threonine-protein kinase